MSSPASLSQMIASGKISFATDHAVKNTEDIAVHLKFLKECIETVKLDDGQVIYILQTSNVEGIINKKIRIGPIEIDITIDTTALTAVAQIFFVAPIVKHILLSSATGALKFNNDVEFDFNVTPGDLACGVAGVKRDASDDVILFWDFTSLGVESKGSIILFHI